MNKKFLAIICAAALAPSLAMAQAAPGPSASPKANGHYTTSDTPIGTLLDDPAAKAVLQKDAPQVVNSDQIDMARGMTLRDIQQYSPDILTDALLAKIDTDLAQLPAQK